MNAQELRDEHYEYLLELLDKEKTRSAFILVSNSKIYLEAERQFTSIRSCRLFVKTEPYIYKEFEAELSKIEDLLKIKIGNILDATVLSISTTPDMTDFKRLDIHTKPVNTPWDEINTGQEKLISQLRSATGTLDYQSIGNTARTVLQKLSDCVFDSKKHIPSDPKIDISPGKFKNRLHTYIESELTGHKFKAITKFAESFITASEASIDLANGLTHDLNAQRIIAEAGVISVVSVVGLIKIIYEKASSLEI